MHVDAEPEGSSKPGPWDGVAPEASGAPLRLLVVEDDDDFRETLRILVRRMGPEVPVETVFLSNVTDARLVVDHTRVDVVVSDFHLPDGTGLDLLGLVRHHTPRAHRVVLTGHPEAALDAVGFKETVHRLWDKRDGPTRLLGHLQRLLSDVRAA